VAEVDIRKKATETISQDVKEKRDKEKKEMEDIKRREKELIDSQGAEGEAQADPFEEYMVLRVKKAQLVWTYDKTMKKMEEMKKSIIAVREKLVEADQKNPNFASTYLDRYVQARRDAGIPDEQNSEENFMKYMVEDLDVGF
jgi:HSP90 family molecular chaperone